MVLIGGSGAIWYASRPEPVTVLVAQVKRGAVERTVVNTRAGTVNACRRAKLAPAVGGQIAVLTVDEGDQVKTGQLLIALWNEDLKAEMALARSEARAAAIEVGMLRHTTLKAFGNRAFSRLRKSRDDPLLPPPFLTLNYGAVVKELAVIVWFPPSSIANTSKSYSVSGARNSGDTDASNAPVAEAGGFPRH
jgi:Biotin-lipoyl like